MLHPIWAKGTCFVCAKATLAWHCGYAALLHPVSEKGIHFAHAKRLGTALQHCSSITPPQCQMYHIESQSRGGALSTWFMFPFPATLHGLCLPFLEFAKP
jgi:hypothetical protein